MKISIHCLHSYYGGIQNNGGSKTLLRCAEALRELGNRVDIVASVDKFTYFKHPKPVKKIPKDADVLIAASLAEIPAVNKFPGKKCYYMRGWENWQSKHIDEILKSFKGKIIVNSSWLKEKLERKGIKSKLCFAGYDDVWEPGLKKSDKITIGTLYHKKKTKNYSFFKKVRDILGYEKYRYLEIGRYPMNDEQLKKIYQQCDIWFTATYHEGFHNVPLEAALCGAIVVCSGHPRNGMSDYAYPYTASTYTHGDIKDAVRAIKFPMMNANKSMILQIKNNIGTRKQNMKKFMELIK